MRRCLWIGCSIASEPEPSDTKVSPALHVLLLKRCTLVLQQWLCTLSTGVAVPVQYMVGFGWSYWNAWYSLASYPGSLWAGKRRAWYPLFVHVLNFPKIFGGWELSCYIDLYNRDIIMCTYRYTVCTFSNQWWSSFDRSYSCTLHCPPTGRYFWYESQDSTGSFRFGHLLGEICVCTATAW